MTSVRFEHDNYYQYDLREPPRKIINPDRIRTNKSPNSTDDWTNIPFYPTAEKKRDMIQQYGKEKAEEIIEYRGQPFYKVNGKHHEYSRSEILLI